MTRIVTFVLGGFSKFVSNLLNQTVHQNPDNLRKMVFHRGDRGLVTISNHETAVDDPAIFATLFSISDLTSGEKIRWTFCESNRCFKNPILSAIFTFGNCLPITRGEGIFQPELDCGIKRLEKGDWLHVFPEGSRVPVPGSPIRPLKLGVARLVYEPDTTPYVLPIYHSGLHQVLPIGGKIPVTVGKNIYVTYGEPIDLEQLVHEAKLRGDDKMTTFQRISDLLREKLEQLRLLHFFTFQEFAPVDLVHSLNSDTKFNPSDSDVN